MTFDPDDFVSRCLASLTEPDPLSAIAEVVERSVGDRGGISSTVSLPLDPDDDGVLYKSAELLVVNVIFPERFRTGIHDHRIPAVIGAWAGFEDNLLYRPAESGLQQSGATRLKPGEVLVLDRDAIHDVHSPSDGWSGAIHVYLGDLNSMSRSSWAAADASEQPCRPEEMERRWTDLAVATGLVAAYTSTPVEEIPSATGNDLRR